MSLKIIHVNRNLIGMNAKDGGNRPVYKITEEGVTTYGREMIIHGPSRMVYNGTQLNCGARAWIETEAEVEIIDPCLYNEAKDSVEYGK